MTHRAYSVAALLVLLAAVGALAAWQPPVAVATVGSLVVFAAAITIGSQFWWILTLIALGGPLVLGYGFANLGLPGTVPIPVTDLLIAALLLRVALAGGQALPRRPLPFVLAAAFVLYATIRLAFDFPLWGTNAVRDYTLPFELGALFVGYWTMATWGVQRWTVWLERLFVVSAAYLLFYPLRDQLIAVSPVVGLQQPVPLFGTFPHAGTTAASGLLFAGIVSSSQKVRFFLSASFLAVLALVQSRGIYLALMLALLVVLFLPRVVRGVRTDVVRALAGAAAVAAVIFTLVPATGRIGGEVSPAFVTAQLSTLLGSEGPGAGSLETREQFISSTLDRVSATSHGWLWGVGLGPDLAGGFHTGSDVDVRKPHDDYLEVFARMGVVGLLLFGSMLGVLLGRLVAACRKSHDALEARFLLWVACTAAVFLIIAATQPLLAYPYGTVPLFLALGAALAIDEMRTRVEPSTLMTTSINESPQSAQPRASGHAHS